LRYFIELSYNGVNFHGWQCQPNAISIQESVESSLQILLKEKKLKINGAGRTDTGVHAIQMFAHFDYHSKIDVGSLVFKLNSFLDKNIVIKNILRVSNDAHARFDAISREYKYFITKAKDVYSSHTKYFFSKNLNMKEIDKAIKTIKKTNNFQSFCKSKTDVTNYNCDIHSFNYEIKNSELIFTISANRFLRNMVRSLIGTILDIGLSKISNEDLKNIIDKSNRIYAGPSVPAHGLFLTKVEYPKNIFIYE
tara:strand:+ start:49 stop:801 length:753 start_codon:yes stop_codon:yes gene_type:complete